MATYIFLKDYHTEPSGATGSASHDYKEGDTIELTENTVDQLPGTQDQTKETTLTTQDGVIIPCGVVFPAASAYKCMVEQQKKTLGFLKNLSYALWIFLGLFILWLFLKPSPNN